MATRDPRWVLKDRPSFALIIGLIVTGVCALVSFAFDVLNGEPVQFVISLALALAPVPLLLAAVLALDRMEPEPLSNLVFAFAWGAGVAVLVAGVVNSLNLRYIIDTVNLSAASARNVAATFGAPVVEESMKGLVLLGLLRFRRAEFDGPTDGIIYASMVGLGFAMSENVSYYVAALNSDQGGIGLAATVVLRGVLSPFAHPLFSSMIGIAVAYAAQRKGSDRVSAVMAGWAGAMILHGLWNGLVSYGGLRGLVIAYLVLLAVLVALIVVVVRDRRRIVALIQRYLPPYEPTKLVNRADVYMLSALSRRRQARQWAKAHGGKRGLRAMSDYQLAATELGLLHERAARHMVDEDAFHEEQRALLECMSVARADFPLSEAHLKAAAKGTPPPGYAPGAPG
ncbi:PrsW family intramembrane metalloprotease [Nonomuraea rhizosphaerae]|uniref:PrsW family intramembrane metalloprotease n=1 Tax=Nonomuraea rhizosphaerae TaxID=2665663 RepID=UPI001C5D9C6B|nr:PrsW family intramembrane metalloprotease [Nonomuraea rhizosphaerae]